MCVALLASASIARAAIAQDDTGSCAVSGRVVDAEFGDLGVGGAVVRLDGADAATVADADGHFAIADVPCDSATLVFEATHYGVVRVNVVPGAQRDPLVVSLGWVDEAHVSETVAPGATTPQTASTTEVTARDISAAPHRNAEEILRQVPGLTLVQHGSEGKGHQFFLRGFDAIHGADLELTVDGLPLNEWSNVHAQGYLDLALVLPEFVESVVVTKGPFTLDQGAFAMAGSAAYRLGVPDDDLGWRTAYTVGTTNRHRVFAGVSPPDTGGEQFVGFAATHDDSFGDNRSLDGAAVNGRVRLASFEDGSTLTLTGLAAVSAFELPGTLRNDDVDAGFVDFYGTYDPEGAGSSGRAVVAMGYASGGSGNETSVTGYGGVRSLELLENFTGFLVDPVHGDRREQVQETWSFGLAGSHASRVAEQVVLRAGAGVRGDVFEQQEHSIGRDLEPLALRRELDAVQLLMHALGGVRWLPGDRVRVDAGLRVDGVHVAVADGLDAGARSARLLAVASPRVTARWSPSEALAWYAAYGRGFRPPEARAFTSFEPERAGIGDEVYDGGEPAITVSDAVELGTRWAPAAWLDVAVTGFATFIERESIFDHVSGVNLELNGTRRLGGELVVSTRPLSWLELGTDLTLVDARFRASGRRVPLAPWLVSGIRGTVTHPSGVGIGVRVLTVAPRTLPHEAKGATLVMADATLGYRRQWFRVDLEVENVLGRELREGEYHYASHWRPGEAASEIPVLHATAGPPLNARLTVGAVF